MQRSLRDLFVDRSQHTDAFCKMLEGRTERRIMLLEAGPGMGKSWLLHIFAHEARVRGLPLVHIDFADQQVYDTLMVVRCCRDTLGPAHFNALTEAINDVTTPRVNLIAPNAAISGSVNVALGNANTLSNSAISVSNVGNTIFKDNFFSVRTDDAFVRQAIEDRINAAFFDSLATLVAQIRVVFLFDTYERNSLKDDRWLSRAADRWICDQLLLRLRDGKLDNAVVVLAGRRLPQFGPSWYNVLGHKVLDQFGQTEVKEYLCGRLGLSTITDDVIQRLWQVGANVPTTLGLFGDRLLNAVEPQIQDDEW
jgi:hypothetical protein